MKRRLFKNFVFFNELKYVFSFFPFCPSLKIKILISIHSQTKQVPALTASQMGMLFSASARLCVGPVGPLVPQPVAAWPAIVAPPFSWLLYNCPPVLFISLPQFTQVFLGFSETSFIIS